MSENTSQSKKEQVFGKYILKKLIRNEAECIKSFVAIQQGFDRLVEIRILAIPGASDSPMAKRFVEELKVLSSIDHPSIISVFDQGIISGKHYFTTTLHNSLRLDDYLKTKGGSLSENNFLKFAEILTDAISILHEDGKLHRGISTKSIFVNLDKDNGTPYIGECSAMKDIREESLTSIGLPTLGEYVPTPEGIGNLPIDKRTDVFLLSNLFYEMLAGKPALPKTRKELGRAIRKNPGGFISIPTLENARGGHKKITGIDELVMKGLDTNPDNRYKDASELAEALRKVAKRHKVELFVRKNAKKTSKTPTGRNATIARKNVQKITTGAALDLTDTNKTQNTSPPDTNGSEKWIIGGALAITIILLLYIGAGFIDVLRINTPTPENKANSIARQEKSQNIKEISHKLLTLTKQIVATPTSDDDFTSRMSIFLTCLNADEDKFRSICTANDINILEDYYIKTGDKRALTQLDKWIHSANLLVKKNPKN